jgi:hypothetical protein
MSEPVTLLIGLDRPEINELLPRISGPVLADEMLPEIRLIDGELLAEDRSAWNRYRVVRRTIFHGIFEDDLPAITSLALWGGPCLPNALGMLVARPRITNLAFAKRASRFADLARSYFTHGQTATFDSPTVIKWGEWHCGEGKELVNGEQRFEEPTLAEPYVAGDAVRVQVIGGRAWQIRLGGDDWKKSIHHSTAVLVPCNDELVEDTKRQMTQFGVELGASDYIVSADGSKHLLEFNHIPNVTVFPEIRAAYLDYCVEWAERR